MKYRDGTLATEDELTGMAQAVIAFIAQEIIDRQDEGDMLDLDVESLERFLLTMFSDHLARTAVGSSCCEAAATTRGHTIH